MANLGDKATLSEPSHPTKLPQLPKDAIIQRRPIASRPSPNHPSTSKRLFVSSKTPFRSITTRVRKQLDKYLRTASSTRPQAVTSRLAKRDLSLGSRVAALKQAQGSGIGLEESGEVVVAGTGKAIEKVLNIAAFFRGQGDCIVMLKTGSVGAVDDVVQDEGENEWENDNQVRSRMLSCLEASIKLR